MSQKKAILLVSFGTSYLESKAKAIDRIFTDVTEHFPDHAIYEAWTSKMILNILRKRDNLSIPSVEEAMETIVADGVQKLTVQPTHLINGLENDIMIHTILERAMDFIEVTFCDPLLTTTEDHRKVLNCLMAEYQSLSHEEALVLMGHGTAYSELCLCRVRLYVKGSRLPEYISGNSGSLSKFSDTASPDSKNLGKTNPPTSIHVDSGRSRQQGYGRKPKRFLEISIRSCWLSGYMSYKRIRRI